MINKPGYLRLDLTFYLQEYEVEYIANSTALIARYWKNLEKFYTMSRDGDVKVLPIFKMTQLGKNYSLDNFSDIRDTLKKLKR